MRIQVLMSTYNGERYIKEQIESILKQADVDVSLLIRDDGSKDSTKYIIQNIKDPRVSFLFENNIGVKRSFLKLIKLADPTADFYAFSDQDDIWLEDKLITAAKVLMKEDPNIPLIYGSSVFLYTNGEISGKQFECPQLNLGNFLIKNYYPGCTMVFNKNLACLINKIDYTILAPNPLHDHWLNLVCTACGGKVLIDTNPHIFYRQHEGNVIGDRGFFQKVKSNGLLGHSDNTRYKICKELHALYGQYEDKKATALIETVLNYPDNFRKRMKLALNADIKPLSIAEKISIFLVSITGKF